MLGLGVLIAGVLILGLTLALLRRARDPQSNPSHEP